MMLLIDLGNRRLKWALWQDGRWIADGQAVHFGVGGWLLPLARIWQARRPIELCLLVDVERGPASSQLHALLERLQCPIETLHSASEHQGLRCAYPDPQRFGADRWAAMIGAWEPGVELMVADAGTALTIDWVAADGEHRGGWILPGIGLMARSLAQGTARIGEHTPRWSIDPGRDTDEAVASGCWLAASGALVIAQQWAPGARWILSGGDAGGLSSILGRWHTVTVRPRLVLEGLLRWQGLMR